MEQIIHHGESDFYVDVLDTREPFPKAGSELKAEFGGFDKETSEQLDDQHSLVDLWIRQEIRQGSNDGCQDTGSDLVEFVDNGPDIRRQFLVLRLRLCHVLLCVRQDTGFRDHASIVVQETVEQSGYGCAESIYRLTNDRGCDHVAGIGLFYLVRGQFLFRLSFEGFLWISDQDGGSLTDAHQQFIQQGYGQQNSLVILFQTPLDGSLGQFRDFGRVFQPDALQDRSKELREDLQGFVGEFSPFLVQFDEKDADLDRREEFKDPPVLAEVCLRRLGGVGKVGQLADRLSKDFEGGRGVPGSVGNVNGKEFHAGGHRVQAHEFVAMVEYVDKGLAQRGESGIINGVFRFDAFVLP